MSPRAAKAKRTFLYRLGLTAGLAAIMFAGTGCSPNASAPVPAAQVRPRSTAALAFIAPAPGAVISGTTLHVQITLTGAEIVPQTSNDLRPDKGHIHLSLDGRVVSMAYGVEQDVQVTPGPHILLAEFVATDHFPFNPRVISTVTLTVR